MNECAGAFKGFHAADCSGLDDSGDDQRSEGCKRLWNHMQGSCGRELGISGIAWRMLCQQKDPRVGPIREAIKNGMIASGHALSESASVPGWLHTASVAYDPERPARPPRVREQRHEALMSRAANLQLCVGMEQVRVPGIPTDGALYDRSTGRYTLLEGKIARSAIEAILAAGMQLLHYRHRYQERGLPVDRLIVIGEHALTGDGERFLATVPFLAYRKA